MTNRIFHEDYPNNPYIYAQYTSGGKIFHSKYKIIALGHYPQNVKYTQKNKHGVQYQIPDGYIVKTEVAGQMLCCETKYTFASKVLYTVTWKEGRAEWMVSSERSASARIEQFGGSLAVKVVDKRKRPLNEVSISQQNKRFASFGKEAHEKIKQFIVKHQMILESKNPICIYNMELGCENQIINIKYNSIISNAKLDAYVRAYEFQENSDGIVVDEQEIGNGVYQSIRSLLKILIPIWSKSILQPGETINLKLGGDRRNIINIGKEKYETLAKVGHLFEYQLWDLKENGIYDDNGIHWPIEFFFSGDWKFMYNIMGLNAPNAKYFCLYCNCETGERWNMDLQWPINENTKCKKKPALFPAIKQENYIPDELHLLLRISDVLMECFFNDLFKKKEFEQQIKSQIEQTMKTIKVHFEFFKSKSHGQRGEDIEKLWRDFYGLYVVLRKPFLTNSEIDDFEIKEDITPYMHIFSKHVPEFLRNLKEKNLSLRIFSTSSIEKKNHNQVRLFFGRTTMGGEIKGKSVVHDIMEFENCQLYYLINNTPQEIQMRNINAENKEN
ncbi:hypothetical protein GLOIN_2v1828103 [Rhizophagus irregularis DAOM 181602=DAOM 197198]|nr:hypothetical protein GLOIN_2v1828103 [Rhizophagus irregularis DAOM 181602=DAOM 197198]